MSLPSPMRGFCFPTPEDRAQVMLLFGPVARARVLPCQFWAQFSRVVELVLSFVFLPWVVRSANWGCSCGERGDPEGEALHAEEMWVEQFQGRLSQHEGPLTTVAGWARRQRAAEWSSPPVSHGGEVVQPQWALPRFLIHRFATDSYHFMLLSCGAVCHSLIEDWKSLLIFYF